VREIFARTSGSDVGFNARIRSISASALGDPLRSQADRAIPRFAATSGEWTFATISGWRIRHFAEQDGPQKRLLFDTGALFA
jgi:hypothetical protein